MCRNCLLIVSPAFPSNQKEAQIKFEKEIRTKILKMTPEVVISFVPANLPIKDLLCKIKDKSPSEIIFKTILIGKKMEALRAFVSKEIPGTYLVWGN